MRLRIKIALVLRLCRLSSHCSTCSRHVHLSHRGRRCRLLAADPLLHRTHSRRRRSRESFRRPQRGCRLGSAMDRAHRAGRDWWSWKAKTSWRTRWVFKPGKQRAVVEASSMSTRPKLPIVWEIAARDPESSIRLRSATYFAVERWEHAPVMAACIAASRRGAVDRRWPGQTRLRTLPLPVAGALRPRHEAALPEPAAVGIFRRLVPLARRSGLFRRPLAQSRHRRSARGRLALFRTESRESTIPAESDRGLPSQGDFGLCVAGTAACQREILGRSSRVARENRHPARRSTRLAQADEPHAIATALPRFRGSPRTDRPLRLGWRQPGRAVLRIARRRRQSRRASLP